MHPVTQRTYILVKSRIVKVDGVRPGILVPDVVGPHVEATGKDAFLNISDNPLNCTNNDSYIHSRSVSLKQAVGKIPPLLFRTIPERARPTPRTGLHGTHLDLTAPRKSMADELPINQVGGCVNSASGKEFKCGRAEEEGRRLRARSGHDADGGIGVEAPDDGVREGHVGRVSSHVNTGRVVKFKVIRESPMVIRRPGTDVG